MTIRRVSVPQVPQRNLQKEVRKEVPAQGKVEVSGGDEGVKKEWLIIYYGAADNNLTDYLYSDMNEVENVGSDKNTHIVAFFDAGKKSYNYPWTQGPSGTAQGNSKNPPYTLPTPFEGAKIFYLKKDNNPKKVTSPVIANLGQVNSADPKFMADVISTLIKKYPAKHVAVIISDHGGGWEGAVEDDHPRRKFMNLGEIKEAIKRVYEQTGRKIDLLGWDACLMGSAEVAYALKPYVNIMVGSEQFEGGDGWPYPSIFATGALKALQEALSKKLNVSPEDFAKMIIKGAESSPEQIKTLAATDLRKMDGFVKRLNAFTQAILKNEGDLQNIKNALRSAERFGSPYFNYRDIFDFARRIAEDKNIKDQALKKAAKELFEYRKELFIAVHRNEKYHPHAYGLQAEASSYSVKKPAYQSTDFAKDTTWDEAIAKLR